MKNGTYKTKAGSIVRVSGKHCGIFEIEFDWLEEDNACCDCEPWLNHWDGVLEWACDYCGGGSAELIFEGE